MPEIVITQKDQGRMFEVNQGDLIMIRLAENLTTGYGWELEELDGPVLELLDSDYSEDRGEGMGRGGMRSFRFLAKSPGTQHIQLGYRRPWEDAAVEHFDVDIKVR